MDNFLNDLIIADCHDDGTIDWYTDEVDDGKYLIIERDSDDKIDSIETNL
jgi:hypothetical protein